MRPHWNLQPEVPLPRLRSIFHLWSCAACLGCAGVAALAIDLPLARWVARGACPDPLEKLGNLAEVFGHGLGIALILVVIGVLDPVRRTCRAAHRRSGAGIGTSGERAEAAGRAGEAVSFDLQADMLDSFGGWFPLLSNSSWEQGFPSSHTATAVGLAIALSWLYPRGRWLFPALAALAGMQRVLAEAHFLSDVLWGAAVGCIFAPLCVYGSRLSRAFDRLEIRLSAEPAASRATIPSAGMPPAIDVPQRRSDAA